MRNNYSIRNVYNTKQRLSNHTAM